MKSAVLYYKNGTLAEERFKNLTPLQWMFHYKEIKKYRKVEEDRVNNMLDTLILAVNRKMGIELIKLRNEGTINQEPEGSNVIPTNLTGDNFAEEFSKILKLVPSELEIAPEVFKKNNGLKKISRADLLKTVGIYIDEE